MIVALTFEIATRAEFHSPRGTIACKEQHIAVTNGFVLLVDYSAGNRGVRHDRKDQVLGSQSRPHGYGG